MKYLIDRAKERSTWVGITAIASGMGLYLSPEHIELITSLGIAIAGLIATMTKDTKE